MNSNAESVINHKYKDRMMSYILDDYKSRARIGIQKVLDITKERHYKINDNEVTKEEFFRNLSSTDKNYFTDHTYMSIGLDKYTQTYKDILSPNTAYEVYKSFLSFDDKIIQDSIPLKDIFPNGLRYTNSEEYNNLN